MGKRTSRFQARARFTAPFLVFLAFILTACSSSAVLPSPTPKPSQVLPEIPPPGETLFDTWGPYLAEREWGNPREAIKRGDGWSFTYEKALATPYRFGEDGIAGITDHDLSVAFAFSFFQAGQPYLTERLYGFDGPTGQYGETILEDRRFYENTPTHSYMRYGYAYPRERAQVNTMIEYAKYDNQTMVARVTLTNITDEDVTVHLVPQVWFHAGGNVIHAGIQTWDAVYPEGHFVVIAEALPTSWQVTLNEYPQRAAINAAIATQGKLKNNGEGNKAAWDFEVKIPKGEEEILQFGIAQATDFVTAQEAAEQALSQAQSLITLRQTEARRLYVDDVIEHQATYQAALMQLLWNKMYYAYDGSYQPEWEGDIAINDVILVPDKWEFPWPAMWDTCFQAKVATLADTTLGKRDLVLFLSDRWQNETGHVPNVEWTLQGETPPLFAWAAWQIYQQDGDLTFLEALFPRLEMHYAFVRRAYDRDRDSLHTGGFMGMDNIPRPGFPDEEEADLSGWVAFFAQDMARIADELGQPQRSRYYRSEYDQIIAQINTQLWDVETGFYYDRNARGFLLEKSYTGLIPFIAGAPNAEQTSQIIEHLTNPQEFWTPYGIRSLSADSNLYEPGHSESGWKNSNWRGPIWMPINYLLVQRLEESHPETADQLREALIRNVEAQWQTTGRFWEYYDAETGQGLGADHQTGWTALVANLIAEKYGAPQE